MLLRCAARGAAASSLLTMPPPLLLASSMALRVARRVIRVSQESRS